MPEPGAVRWNDEADDWERFVERPDTGLGRVLPGYQGVKEWQRLPAGDPLRGDLESVIKSGLFNDMKNDDLGEVAFHRKGGDDEDWYYYADAVRTAENLETYGPPPPGRPDYEEWPPTRLETDAEAKEAGHVDETGKAVPERVVDTKAVTAAREKEARAQAVTAAREKEARAQKDGSYASAGEATAAAQQDPALAGYTPKYIPATGQWQLTPPEEAAEPSRVVQGEEGGGPPGSWVIQKGDGSITPYTPPQMQTDIEQEMEQLELEAAQAALQPQRPGSLAGLMAEAIDSGDIDQARFLRDFENEVTPYQYLQLTLEYADNPDALKVLFDFARARRPGTVGTAGKSAFGQQPSPSHQVNPLLPSERAGFGPGSFQARSFDAQDPATQQQYLLGQQYNATKNPQPSPALDVPQPSPALDVNRPTQYPFASQPAAPIGTQPVFQAPATGQNVQNGVTGTPGEGYADPFGPSIREYEERQAPSDVEELANEGWVIRTPAGGKPVDNSTFKGFMAGFKPFADTPQQSADMARNLAAGNPYAGKEMSTDPLTGQWSRWVDAMTGEPFKQAAGGGLEALPFSDEERAAYQASKPKPPTTPSPFGGVDLEGYLKAAQTLGASKKPKQPRRIQPSPFMVQRR